MKRVAVRALNFSTGPFCMKFRGGSNREGPEVQNGQKWAKNAKKVLWMIHKKMELKLKRKYCMKWVAVGAPILPTIPFCVKFRGEASREGPIWQNGHKWAKNGPKIFQILANFCW